MGNIRKSLLKNGITVISEKIDSVRSISLGFWVVVGSRNEDKSEKGISHFIEHTLFKGTKKRNTQQIAKTIESKGGSLDAFTSKEITCFYTRGLSSLLRLSVDVISDILTRPLFPQTELKKELNVVKEEIKDNEDTPGKYIFDLLFKHLFKGHPLSHSVLGEKKDVEQLTKKKIVSYFHRWYNTKRMIVTASGFVEHNDLVEYLNEFIKTRQVNGSMPLFKRARLNYNPVTFKFHKSGIFQTHLTIASPTFKYNDPRKYPLLVLDTILSDGMSSLLFQKLREEKGLVYEVFSFADFYSDTGVFGVYLACAPDKIGQAKETVISIYKKLVKYGVSKKAINEAKIKLKTKLLIGLESTSARMMRLGKSEIYLNDVIPIDEINQLINKVSYEDVNEIIRYVLSEERLSYIYVGDFESGVKRNLPFKK